MRLLVALLLCVTPVMAGELRLVWEPSAGATSYTVHYGTEAGNYTTALPLGNITEATLTMPDVDTTYYLAVTATNSNGTSGFSREIMSWLRPEVHTFATSDCSQAGPTEPVACNGVVAGSHFATDVMVRIPYAGVSIANVTRVDAATINVAFSIAPDAVGGVADLVVENPWQASDGATGGAGPVSSGGVTITPVVLPSPPADVRPI